MTKLDQRANGKYITRKKRFVPIASFRPATIEKVFDFAYSMSFGKIGEHRDHRSGGTHHRKNGEIFADTFQGKLSEFAFYNIGHAALPLENPDVGAWKRGEWDDVDFVVNGHKLNIKSTKAIGNLLLLETKDWTDAGHYIPNKNKISDTYDFFILMRMQPFAAEIMGRNKLKFENTVDKEKLRKLICGEQWTYDIAGWISHDQLISVIKNKHIIHKDDMLNGLTRMDAENYYVQSGDMHDISELINLLKTQKKQNENA